MNSSSQNPCLPSMSEDGAEGLEGLATGTFVLPSTHQHGTTDAYSNLYHASSSSYPSGSLDFEVDDPFSGYLQAPSFDAGIVPNDQNLLESSHQMAYEPLMSTDYSIFSGVQTPDSTFTSETLMMQQSRDWPTSVSNSHSLPQMRTDQLDSQDFFQDYLNSQNFQNYAGLLPFHDSAVHNTAQALGQSSQTIDQINQRVGIPTPFATSAVSSQPTYTPAFAAPLAVYNGSIGSGTVGADQSTIRGYGDSYRPQIVAAAHKHHLQERPPSAAARSIHSVLPSSFPFSGVNAFTMSTMGEGSSPATPKVMQLQAPTSSFHDSSPLVPDEHATLEALDGTRYDSPETDTSPIKLSSSPSPSLDESSDDEPSQAVTYQRGGRQFTSADEARPYVYTRVPLNITGDDVDMVKQNSYFWVDELTDALLTTIYKDPPATRPTKLLASKAKDQSPKKNETEDSDIKKTPSKKEEPKGDDTVDEDACKDGSKAKKLPNKLTKQEESQFTKWQEDAAGKLKVIFDTKGQEIVKEAEAHAWIIFEEIVEVHETGSVKSTFPPAVMPCSERLQLAVQEIKNYAIIRQTVFGRFNAYELAANPEAFSARKVINLFGNSKRNTPKKGKKKGTDAEPDVAEEDGEEIVVKGSKKKGQDADPDLAEGDCEDIVVKGSNKKKKKKKKTKAAANTPTSITKEAKQAEEEQEQQPKKKRGRPAKADKATSKGVVETEDTIRVASPYAGVDGTSNGDGQDDGIVPDSSPLDAKSLKFVPVDPSEYYPYLRRPQKKRRTEGPSSATSDLNA